MPDGARSGDRLIIQQFLREDRDAIRTIEDWIDRAVVPYRRRLHCQWDDIRQEIRLEVVRLLQTEKFRGESSLKTYLWRVASHTCIDHLRRQSRWRQAPAEDAVHATESADPSPLETLLEEETWKVRMAILREMPEDCHRIWRLILEGRSYRQIGTRLGVSEGALRVRALRCRKKVVQAVRERTAGARL